MSERDPESARFDRAVGAILRRAREEKRMTLLDVEERSRGRFKRSTVAGYERGERAISLARFARLAGVYDRPPEDLLGEILDDLYPGLRGRIVIDESRLGLVEQPTREAVRALLRRVREERGLADGDVLTIRSGDLRIAILGSGEEPETALRKLMPVLVEPGATS